MKSVTFMANQYGAQFAFACSKPRHGMHMGQPAIRMSAPAILLAAEPRHNRVRGQVPGEERRVRPAHGPHRVQGKLVDMSTDGRAFLLGDPAIPMCGGTELKRVQIRSNGGDPIEVDIRVEQVLQAVLPNGARATRIGCRIITDKERLEKLIRFFVIELQLAVGQLIQRRARNAHHAAVVRELHRFAGQERGWNRCPPSEHRPRPCG